MVVLTTKAVECIGINELWAGFGVSYRFCLIATHEIADAQQSMAFLKCFLPSLGVMVDVTEAFCDLADPSEPSVINESIKIF